MKVIAFYCIGVCLFGFFIFMSLIIIIIIQNLNLKRVFLLKFVHYRNNKKFKTGIFHLYKYIVTDKYFLSKNELF